MTDTADRIWSDQTACTEAQEVSGAEDANLKGRKGLGQSAQREQGGQESVPHEQKTGAKQKSRDGYYRCQSPKLQDCGDKSAL